MTTYSVPELIELARELKKLGVCRLKAGDVEMELVLPMQQGRDLAPEDQEAAMKQAADDLRRELEAAS